MDEYKIGLKDSIYRGYESEQEEIQESNGKEVLDYIYGNPNSSKMLTVKKMINKLSSADKKELTSEFQSILKSKGAMIPIGEFFKLLLDMNLISKKDDTHKRYSKYYESKKIEETIDNEDVAKIIGKLRDNSFGNENMRNELINLLTTLKMYKDPSARKLFKMVGNALTNIGGSLLGDSGKESEYEKEIKDGDIEPIEDYEDCDERHGPLIVNRYESKIKDKERIEEGVNKNNIDNFINMLFSGSDVKFIINYITKYLKEDQPVKDEYADKMIYIGNQIKKYLRS